MISSFSKMINPVSFVFFSRDCSLCKKAIETERFSLREKAEVAAIWDSVKLDAPNKQIVCTCACAHVHMCAKREKRRFSVE